MQKLKQIKLKHGLGVF